MKKVFLKFSQNSQGNTCARQKQPFRGALEKRCSDNIQHTYRRISMPKCDFNEVAKHRCFSVTFARFLRTSLFKEHPQWLLLYLKRIFDYLFYRLLVCQSCLCLYYSNVSVSFDHQKTRNMLKRKKIEKTLESIILISTILLISYYLEI